MSISHEGYTLEQPNGRDTQGRVGRVGAELPHLCAEQSGGSEPPLGAVVKHFGAFPLPPEAGDVRRH